MWAFESTAGRRISFLLIPAPDEATRLGAKEGVWWVGSVKLIFDVGGGIVGLGFTKVELFPTS